MKFNKFDDHARKEISTHETPLDTEALWGKVQADLQPKRKKRFAWVWFSASSFLIAILLAGYFYANDGTTNSTLSSVQMKNKKELTLSKESIDKNIIANTQTDKIKSTAKIQENISPNPPNEKVTILDKKKTESKIKQARSQQFNANTPTAEVMQQSKTNVATTDLNKKTIKDSNSQNHPSKILFAEKIKSKSAIDSNTATIVKSIENSKSIEEAKILIKNEDAKELKKEIATLSEINSAANKEEDNSDDEIKEEAKDIAESSEENFVLNDNPEKEEEDNSDDEIKLKKNFRVGIGFRAGIGSSITNLSANENGSDEFLRNLRNESETNLETIDLGIDILLKHKSGVYISTGLDYVRATRKLNYNFEESKVDTILGIASISVNPITMDSTFNEGLVARTTINFRNKETYNNLHMINIPIQLGASINYERWSFGIQGGALFNIVLNHKGEIFETEDTFYHLKTDSNNWFKDNLGMSFQGAVLIGYNFTDKFQILGGPSFRSKLKINSKSNPVQQTQNGIGVQLAARYWW